MIPKNEVLSIAPERELLPNVVAKDYVLGWLLMGIAGHPLLCNWVFKGGTCLKKCFFETYRFSEDLDFTVPQDMAYGVEAYRTALLECTEKITEETGIYFPQDGIEVKETLRVLEAVKPNTAMGLRDRSMLELLYSTGIRRRELANLNLSDFSFERGELLIVNPKGKRDRLVPVGEMARQFTETYRRLVRPWMVSGDAEKALFVNHRGGGRLSLRSVSKIVHKAAQASGVTKRISPHSFRHAMATHLLRNHADLRHIQAILGHAQITSTELYTHLALEDLKEAVRRSHPHGRWKT